MATAAGREPEPKEQSVAVVGAAPSVVLAPGSVAGVRALQRAIGNRATARLVARRRVLARRSAHSDTDLFSLMQKFRSKNDHLSETEQNKIFWSIKKATDSDEVAWKFFDYYSGYLGAGYKIKKMEGTQLTKARKTKTLAETKSSDDTYVDPDVFSFSDESLGPLLLHEFAHTGHHPNVLGSYDFEEGQAYGVEYYYAEHTGDSSRMAKIIGIITGAAKRWGPDQEAAAKENFRVTYVLMKELANLTRTGTSALKPLAGKTGDDGRLMAADFVSSH